MNMYEIEYDVKAFVLAGGYSEDEFEKFTADYGWKPWMEDYTEAEDDEVSSESELNEIDEILKRGFKKVFNK